MSGLGTLCLAPPQQRQGGVLDFGRLESGGFLVGKENRIRGYRTWFLKRGFEATLLVTWRARRG